MDLTVYESIDCKRNIPANIFITSIEKSCFHWHFDSEFILVLKGSIQVNTSPKVSILKENDILLINSKTVHEIKKTSEDNICLIIQVNHVLFQDWKRCKESITFILTVQVGGFIQVIVSILSDVCCLKLVLNLVCQELKVQKD